jgi:type I restriction-modification system DNA methylase subunit
VDLLLKGEGEAADNIVGGPEYSTLSNDAFPSREFDFMLSNPPYGKNWKSDLERVGGKSGIKDPRFIINYADDPDYSLVTRSSDGQLLFLVSILSKMKHDTMLGSRIAEVHNGSSLFTGDAGPLTAQFYNQFDPPTAVLNWKGNQEILFLEPSGSGARYGRQGSEYWEHQGEVKLELNGTKFVCRAP